MRCTTKSTTTTTEATTSAEILECDPGWVKRSVGDKVMCFKLVKRTKIEKGLEVCKEVGANIPLPENVQEDNDLYKIVQDFGVKGAALDGTDVEKEGDWRDSAGKTLIYTNWGEDQPSNAYDNENYLHYWEKLNGKQNHASGSLEENIICVKTARLLDNRRTSYFSIYA